MNAEDPTQLPLQTLPTCGGLQAVPCAVFPALSLSSDSLVPCLFSFACPFLLCAQAPSVYRLHGGGSVAGQLDAACEFAARYLQPQEVRYYSTGQRAADGHTRSLPGFLNGFAGFLTSLTVAPERALSSLAVLIVLLGGRFA